MRSFPTLLIAALLAAGCAQRPLNPPLKAHEENATYEFEHLERNRGKQDDLVILAFSGGGTRAASFSYGVLEALKRIEITSSTGETWRSTSIASLCEISAGPQNNAARRRVKPRKVSGSMRIKWRACAAKCADTSEYLSGRPTSACTRRTSSG